MSSPSENRLKDEITHSLLKIPCSYDSLQVNQEETLERLREIQSNLSIFNEFSSTRLTSNTILFKDYQELITKIKDDMTLIHKKIKSIKEKLEKKHPDLIRKANGIFPPVVESED